MADVERAVEEADLGPGGRGGQRGAQETGRGRKDHAEALFGQLADGPGGVVLQDVEAAHGLDPVAQRLLHGEPPLLVRPGPERAVRVLVVQEGDLQIVQRRVDDALDQTARRLGGVGHQHGALVPGLTQELRRDGGKIGFDLRGRAVLQAVVAEDLQIAQQGLVLGQLRAQVRVPEAAAKARHVGEKAALPVLVPDAPVLAAQQLEQGGIAPRRAEDDVLDLRDAVEIEELIVGEDLRLFAPRGEQAADLRAHRERAEVAQDRHALVTLHDKEAVEILDNEDGLAYALLQMGGGQRRPLGGKLARLLQKREEGGGEGIPPGGGIGARDLLEIDAEGAERDLVLRAQMLDLILERVQIGEFMPRSPRLDLFQPEPPGLLIGNVRHIQLLFPAHPARREENNASFSASSISQPACRDKGKANRSKNYP